MVLRIVTSAALPGIYLLFVATLDTPLARPLASLAGRAVIAAGTLGYVGLNVLRPERFIDSMAPVPFGQWECVCSSEITFLLIAATNLYGLAAALLAWHRTPPASLERAQARAIALGFGARDVFMATIFVATATFYSFANWGENRFFDLLFLQGQSVVLVLYMGLVAYGILRAQLFDIDVRIKFTLRQSTVAAVFIAVFFAASELAASVLTDRTGSTFVGVGAAAVLVFFIAPLQRLAERLSDAAMPNVHGTPEYLTYRKFELYRHAVESAAEDGVVTARERAVLDTLRRDLGIGDADADAMERDVLVGGAVA